MSISRDKWIFVTVASYTRSKPVYVAGHAGYYQLSVIIFTVLNAVAQFGFQIVLLLHHPYGSIVSPTCKFVVS